MSAPLDAPHDDAVELTDAVTAEFTIVVNGLSMPAALWPRVMAAVRGLFPQITAGLSDPASIQAVMREFVIEWMSTWEARQAAPDPSEAANAAGRAAQDSRDAAAARARADGHAMVPTVTT